jgi:hypothetical protein
MNDRKNDIGKFWWMVNRKDAVEFLVGDVWIKGTIKGIDLINKTVLIQTPSGHHWQKVFFQLNENHPVHEKVRQCPEL